MLPAICEAGCHTCCCLLPFLLAVTTSLKLCLFPARCAAKHEHGEATWKMHSKGQAQGGPAPAIKSAAPALTTGWALQPENVFSCILQPLKSPCSGTLREDNRSCGNSKQQAQIEMNMRLARKFTFPANQRIACREIISASVWKPAKFAVRIADVKCQLPSSKVVKQSTAVASASGKSMRVCNRGASKSRW